MNQDINPLDQHSGLFALVLLQMAHFNHKIILVASSSEYCLGFKTTDVDSPGGKCPPESNL